MYLLILHALDGLNRGLENSLKSLFLDIFLYRHGRGLGGGSFGDKRPRIDQCADWMGDSGLIVLIVCGERGLIAYRLLTK